MADFWHQDAYRQQQNSRTNLNADPSQSFEPAVGLNRSFSFDTIEGIASNLCSAVEKSDIDAVRQIVENGQFPVEAVYTTAFSIRGHREMTSLHYAAELVTSIGHHILRMLCRKIPTDRRSLVDTLGAGEVKRPHHQPDGRITESTDLEDYTPLTWACLHANAVAVPTLISAGANVNSQDSHESTTPLMAISSRRCTKRSDQDFQTIMALLRLHARFDLQDRRQNTALHYLLQDPSMYHLARRFITRSPIPLSMPNIHGWTILHCVAFYSKDETGDIASMIIDYGTPLDTKNLNGWTALELAKKIGNSRMVTLLQGYEEKLRLGLLRQHSEPERVQPTAKPAASIPDASPDEPRSISAPHGDPFVPPMPNGHPRPGRPTGFPSPPHHSDPFIPPIPNGHPHPGRPTGFPSPPHHASSWSQQQQNLPYLHPNLSNSTTNLGREEINDEGFRVNTSRDGDVETRGGRRLFEQFQAFVKSMEDSTRTHSLNPRHQPQNSLHFSSSMSNLHSPNSTNRGANFDPAPSFKWQATVEDEFPDGSRQRSGSAATEDTRPPNANYTARDWSSVFDATKHIGESNPVEYMRLWEVYNSARNPDEREIALRQIAHLQITQEAETQRNQRAEKRRMEDEERERREKADLERMQRAKERHEIAERERAREVELLKVQEAERKRRELEDMERQQVLAEVERRKKQERELLEEQRLAALRKQEELAREVARMHQAEEDRKAQEMSERLRAAKEEQERREKIKLEAAAAQALRQQQELEEQLARMRVAEEKRKFEEQRLKAERDREQRLEEERMRAEVAKQERLRKEAEARTLEAIRQARMEREQQEARDRQAEREREQRAKAEELARQKQLEKERNDLKNKTSGSAQSRLFADGEKAISEDRLSDAALIYARASKLEVLKDPEFFKDIQAITDLMNTLSNHGNEEEAASLCRGILANLESKNLDFDSICIFVTHLAALYSAQEQWALAHPLLDRAYAHKKATFGEYHTETLNIRLNYGNMYVGLGNLVAASNEYNAIINQNLGEDNPMTLYSRYGWADIYTKQGEFAKAEVLYHELLEAQMTGVLGDSDDNTLCLYRDVRNFYKAAARWQEAEDYSRKLVGERARVYGTTHKQTLQAGEELAALCISLRPQDAEATEILSFVRATRYNEQNPGSVVVPDVPAVFFCMTKDQPGDASQPASTPASAPAAPQPAVELDSYVSQLTQARALHEKRNYEQSYAIYLNVFEGFERITGAGSADTMQILEELAATAARVSRNTLFDDGEFKMGNLADSFNYGLSLAEGVNRCETAMQLLLQVVEGRKAIPTMGRRHPSTIKCQFARGYLRQLTNKDFPEAERIFTEAFGVIDEFYGPSSLEKAKWLLYVGAVYCSEAYMKEINYNTMCMLRCEQYERQALTIRESRLGPKDELTVKALEKLVVTLKQMKHPDYKIFNKRLPRATRFGQSLGMKAVSGLEILNRALGSDQANAANQQAQKPQ